MTRRTQRDADGPSLVKSMFRFSVRPEFKLDFSLSYEHFEPADRIATGIASFAQKSCVGWIIDEIVSATNAP